MRSASSVFSSRPLLALVLANGYGSGAVYVFIRENGADWGDSLASGLARSDRN